MTEDEQKALRSLLREEVNAAVYASEQRLGGQIGRLDERMNRFENRINQFEDRLSILEVGQQKMQVDLTHVIAVLNEATKVINDIQAAQIALELKVEDNSRSLKRNIQNLSENVHNFSRKFIDINWQTTERILLHERTPIDNAHPRPNSTG